MFAVNAFLRLFTILLACLLPVRAAGQVEPQSETERPTIRVSSNLVTVPVSVTDALGQPVRNLGLKDFRIEEGGRPQRIVSLGEPGKTPVNLALLYDVSGSVSGRFPFERQAAAEFLKLVLKPGDTVSVFSIGLTPKLLQPQTVEMEKAEASILTLEPTQEATAFFDTVVEAAHYLAKHANPGARRVLLAISDGEDNNSQHYKMDDAIRELQRNDCIFYSINPSGPAIRLNVISMRGQAGMEALAAETGGAFLPAQPGDLQALLRQIAAELQAQYLLGFYSTDERTDGGFRQIAVLLPEHPGLRVRARRGYYAPKPMAASNRP